MKEYQAIQEGKEAICVYYRKRSLETIIGYDGGTCMVLKTDAYNERKDEPKGGIVRNLFMKPENCFLLEYDATVCAETRRLHSELQIVQGDIRRIPFRDEMFDAVLDLSTLDHIPMDDMPLALAGYARVLKEDGQLLLIFWCGDEKTVKESHAAPWGPARIYYSHYGTVRGYIEKHFTITDEEIAYRQPKSTECFLVAVRGTKKRSQ